MTKKLTQEELDNLRKICWNNALDAFGTGYIFEMRSNRYRWFLRILDFLGVIMPLLTGLIVLSFGKEALLPWFLIMAGIVGVIQVVGSLWSLVAKWDDSYSYSIQSMKANYRMANNYEKLARNPPDDFQSRYALLEVEDQIISGEDYAQAISEKEKRKGMRAALRQYQRTCAGCGLVPTSMEPTDCNVCGNF